MHKVTTTTHVLETLESARAAKQTKLSAAYARRLEADKRAAMLEQMSLEQYLAAKAKR